MHFSLFRPHFLHGAKVVLGALILSGCGGGGGGQTPAAIPARDRVAFSNSRGVSAIFLMNGDGSGLVSLRSGGVHRSPSWSPDGEKLAFSHSPSGAPGDAEIFTMNRDGSDLRQLTRDEFDDDLPRWSPDGRTLVYKSQRDSRSDLFLIGADGANPRNLTGGRGFATDPIFEAPGRILFSAAFESAANFALFRLDIGSGAIEPVFESNANLFTPALHPDGRRLAYVSDADGLPRIEVRDLQTGTTRILTPAASTSTQPVWSRDGLRLFFTSRRDGNAEIYRANADGASPTRLTNSPAVDRDPAVF